MLIRYESTAGLTTVGYRILNADKTVYAALTTTGVTEISPGGYGVTVPDSDLAGRTVEWYEGSTYTVSESFPVSIEAVVTLTPAERTEVANEVERQIIDDTDTEKVLAAILAKVEGMPVTADTLAIAEGVRVVMERAGGTLDDIYGRTPADPAGQAALDAARDAIIAAIPDIPPPDDGVEITQDTIGTDGQPIGRVQPYAEVTVYRDGASEHQFQADADGDFGYKLPEGSVWVLIARRPPQYLPMTAEVAT